MHLSNVIIAVFIAWILFLQNDSTDANVTGISFEGCFWNLSNYTTRHNLSDKNDPRHCFIECNNTEYIGLQTHECFCSATPGTYALERSCSYFCPGDRNFSCGSENNTYVYYYKVLSTIDVDGEFGFVYLHVFRGGVSYRYEINGTNNTTDIHHYICYDDPSKCVFKSIGAEKTWQDAKSECLVHNQGLVPFRIAMNNVICPPLSDGYFWIGMKWFKIVNTSSTTTSTSTTTTSTSTVTSTSISTTATTASFTSSKPTLSFTTTTGLRSNHTSNTVQISKDSSSNGTNVIAVAVPIAVLLVVLGFILLCKKRKLLCFKKRQQSGEMNDDSNNASPQEIPELISTQTSSSVPPGSTWAPFQSQRQNFRPTTARERDISDGHTVLNTNMSYTNMGMEAQYRFGDRSVGLELAHNEIEDTVQSNMDVDKKRKKKRVKKRSKKDKHSSSVDKEYEDSKGNTQGNHEQLCSHTNDDLSVVNGLTGHSNGGGQDKNETKRKKQRAKEHSYSDEEMKNASPETGSGIFSEHQSERHVAPISPFNGMGNLHHEPNDKIKHNQVGPDPNEVLKEPTDNNNVIRKEKKKKRKKTRERLKENVQNVYDEVGDPITARLVLEEQSDLQNEESSKKHKKKRRKKHKKKDKMNAPKQADLDLDNDEND